MSLINVSGLTFSYDGGLKSIFENVSLQIDTSWKLGLTGRNGRGKTTFLNLLMGRYEYTGEISAGVNFEYFPYEVADKFKDTINVIGEIAGGFNLWELKRELNRLSFPEDALYRPFCSLSLGEQAKALLASLFLKENSFLLIDEPTNHLDMEARKLVGDYLNGKTGFILVSHDRAFLDSCIDHVMSINRRNIEVQKGNFSSWYYNKRLEDERELDENERLKKDIGRLSEAARRASSWSIKAEKAKYDTLNSGLKPDRGYVGHKAAKVMKRSKSIEARREAAAAEKSKLLKNIESAESLRLSPLEYFGDRLLSLKNVSVFYGENAACENVSFEVTRYDRVALCGRNGSGKSSLIKLITGGDVSFRGEFLKGSGLVISHIPQDASFLTGSLSDFASDNGLDESLFKALLRKLDFDREQFLADMKDFSAGQKKKVLIAKRLCQRAHLYVWDEPLNYVDVFSRMQIEELLSSCRSAVLFVEHDRAFIDAVATKRVCL